MDDLFGTGLFCVGLMLRWMDRDECNVRCKDTGYKRSENEGICFEAANQSVRPSKEL